MSAPGGVRRTPLRMPPSVPTLRPASRVDRTTPVGGSSPLPPRYVERAACTYPEQPPRQRDERGRMYAWRQREGADDGRRLGGRSAGQRPGEALSQRGHSPCGYSRATEATASGSRKKKEDTVSIVFYLLIIPISFQVLWLLLYLTNISIIPMCEV
jgi:hypothetical protein